MTSWGVLIKLMKLHGQFLVSLCSKWFKSPYWILHILCYTGYEYLMVQHSWWLINLKWYVSFSLSCNKKINQKPSSRSFWVSSRVSIELKKIFQEIYGNQMIFCPIFCLLIATKNYQYQFMCYLRLSTSKEWRNFKPHPQNRTLVPLKRSFQNSNKHLPSFFYRNPAWALIHL